MNLRLWFHSHNPLINFEYTSCCVYCKLINFSVNKRFHYLTHEFIDYFHPQFTLNPLLFRDLTLNAQLIHYETTFFTDKAEYHLLFPEFTWINNLIQIAYSLLIHFFREFLTNYLYRKLTMILLFILEFTMESLSALRIH